MESGVGDRTFDAHYKRLFFEVIDALVAVFEGRFSETTCEIIEAMASLNRANSFAKYSKSSIDKLGRHYCDDFNDTERGMLSTEVELMITEITMVKKATELSEMKMNDMHVHMAAYQVRQLPAYSAFVCSCKCAALLLSCM